MATSDLNSGWRVWLVAYAPLVFWTGVIFYLSSPQASAAETSRFIKPLIEFFFPSASPDAFQTVHLLIRKAAHFSVYATLAFFAMRAFGRSGISRYRSLVSLVLVIVIATADEINQSFEPERTAASTDVMLDVFGGIMMILTFLAVSRRKRSVP